MTILSITICYIILLLIYIKQSLCSDNPVKTMRERRLEKRLANARNNFIETKEDYTNHPLLKLKPNEEAICFPSLSLASSLSSSLSSSSSSSSPIKDDHIRFYSFDDIFGKNYKFSDFFNSNNEFRKDLRLAARNDFYVKDETISNEANNLLKDPRSSMSSKWGSSNNNEYQFLTNTFQKYNFPTIFTGKMFINELTKLCPETPYRFNSWMDIVGVKNKAISHSWHQDSGLYQKTVMIGLPPKNNYEGIGVFSHAVKLSHRLPDPPINQQNQPRLWSSLCDISFNEEYIIRPIYKKGKEIMVYDDRDIFHSAPDYAYRDSIWRIM